jgi:hypothetical protein
LHGGGRRESHLLELRLIGEGLNLYLGNREQRLGVLQLRDGGPERDKVGLGQIDYPIYL